MQYILFCQDNPSELRQTLTKEFQNIPLSQIFWKDFIITDFVLLTQSPSHYTVDRDLELASSTSLASDSKHCSCFCLLSAWLRSAPWRPAHRPKSWRTLTVAIIAVACNCFRTTCLLVIFLSPGQNVWGYSLTRGKLAFVYTARGLSLHSVGPAVFVFIAEIYHSRECMLSPIRTLVFSTAPQLYVMYIFYSTEVGTAWALQKNKRSKERPSSAS